MTPKADAECPVPGCDAKRWEAALLETNRVLSNGLQDIKSLQMDHRDLQQKNLEALQEQTKHNGLLERILDAAEKQDRINDTIFDQLRNLSKEKVETVDFRLALESMRTESKSQIDLLRTDGKWFIGISLTAVTTILSLVVVLMKVLG